jgi:hypothetical protein
MWESVMEHLINIVNRYELELMFGEGCNVKVTSLNYSTTTKRYVIHSKLLLNNVDESVLDFFPHGLEVIIYDSWKYLGICNIPLMVISSVDVN